MSLEALLTVLGANIIGMPSVPVEGPDLPAVFPRFVATGGLIGTLSLASSARRGSPDYPTSLHYEAMPSPDMVVRLGNRRMGPELELGAFGGGRARGTGLVHLGFGFDF